MASQDPTEDPETGRFFHARPGDSRAPESTVGAGHARKATGPRTTNHPLQSSRSSKWRRKSLPEKKFASKNSGFRFQNLSKPFKTFQNHLSLLFWENLCIPLLGTFGSDLQPQHLSEFRGFPATAGDVPNPTRPEGCPPNSSGKTMRILKDPMSCLGIDFGMALPDSSLECVACSATVQTTRSFFRARLPQNPQGQK